MSAIRKQTLMIALAVSLFATAGVANAATIEEIKEATTALVEYIEAGNLKKAQKEVDFLNTALGELDFEVKKEFFKDDLAGFIGGEITAQSAMGVSVIERTYTRGGNTVTVSLTEMGSGSGLAGLAAMGQMFGQQQGAFRLPGRIPANVSEQAGRVEIMATIGKSIFRAESGNTEADRVKQVATAFPTKELLEHEEGN